MPVQLIQLEILSPYNFGLDYSNHTDAYQWEDYFNTVFKIFDEAIRALKYGRRIIVNVPPPFSDYIPSHHVISRYFMSRKMIWKGEILWKKIVIIVNILPGVAGAETTTAVAARPGRRFLE